MAEQDGAWTTVLLAPQREPRFSAWCHGCGAARAGGTGTVRVHRLGGARRTAQPLVPRALVVPVCTRCRRHRLLVLLALPLLVLVPLIVVAPRVAAHQLAPLIELPRWARAALCAACVGAFLAMLLAPRRVGLDVVHDGRHLRYSFRDRDRALAFAAANLGTIATEPLPPAREEYQPDRQTGDWGDQDSSGDD
jgi:hypothetical protein